MSHLDGWGDDESAETFRSGKEEVGRKCRDRCGGKAGGGDPQQEEAVVVVDEEEEGVVMVMVMVGSCNKERFGKLNGGAGLVLQGRG